MIIAIYNEQNGDIKMVTSCSPIDAGQQHVAWPSHDWIQIYDPKVLPSTHRIDLLTLKPVKLEEAPVVEQARDKITAGFTARGRTYPSGPTDQTNMVQVATVGGKLWCVNPDGEWVFLEHTAAEGAEVLRAFVDFKDRLRAGES